MDIAKNPGPIAKPSKTHSSCEDHCAINLHIVPRQLTIYSGNQLLGIRRSGRFVPSSYVLNSLKANSIFRFRGSRGGKRQISGRQRIPVRVSAWRGTLFSSHDDLREQVLSFVPSTRCASLPRVTPMCLVLNIRSLLKSFAREEIQNELMSNSIDLCWLSETWLREDIDSSLVTPDGYFMLRKDGVNKRGSGVAILCRNDWMFVCESIYDNSRLFCCFSLPSTDL